MGETETLATPKKDWEDRFLAVYEDSGIIAEAARAVGISRATLYRHKARSPEFAKRLGEVKEWAVEELEQVAYKRARDGSDTLVIFLLKSMRPDVYRERVNVHHGGKVNVEIEKGVDDAINRQAAELQRLTERLGEVAGRGEAAPSGPPAVGPVAPSS